LHGSAVARRVLKALDRSTRLWKVWWLLGTPVACGAATLLFFAEELRLAMRPGWADLLDVARIALVWLWCLLAWTCARNVERQFWTPLARVTLAAVFIFMVVI
jgi:hypothetical protein